MASGKRRAPATPKQKAKARKLYEQGGSLAAVGRAVDYAPQTVDSWAKRHGWSRPEGFDQSPAAEKTKAARHRATLVWEDRQYDRANEAAEAADGALAALTKAIAATDAKESRQWVMTWAVAMDKAFTLYQQIKGEGGRDPARTDPEELERGINDIEDILTPPVDEEV